MFRNHKDADLFTLLLLGLCLTLPILIHAEDLDSMTLEESTVWYTTSNTYALGVSTGDLDNDGTKEIVTVGRYETGNTSYAGELERYGQIKIWNHNGTALELKYTYNWTVTPPPEEQPWWRGINGITIEDVDNDGTKEIITVGYIWEHIPVGPWMGCYEGELAIWNWTGTTLNQEKVQKWYTSKDTQTNGVHTGDVDGDGIKEIITVGIYFDMDSWITWAQMRIWNWNGTTLTLENSKEWQETNTVIRANSAYAADVDNDTEIEIVTCGWKTQSGYNKAQVIVWNWNTTVLTLEHNEEWGNYTAAGSTVVKSVIAQDLEDDGLPEIITLGYYGSPATAQIKVWNWNTTTFTLRQKEEWPGPNGAAIHSSYSEDIDSDGIPDIISLGNEVNGTLSQTQLRTWAWNGTSMELKHETYGNFATGVGVAVDDVDNDVIKEMITVGYTKNDTLWNGYLAIWSIPDLIPPQIGSPVQEPSDPVQEGIEVKILSDIVDYGVGVKNATLYYTTDNGTSWQPREMTYNSTTGYYETTILGQPAGTWVKYKITAYDKAENHYTEDNSGEYYVYSVVPEFPAFIILPLFIVFALIAVALTKKIRCKAVAKTT